MLANAKTYDGESYNAQLTSVSDSSVCASKQSSSKAQGMTLEEVLSRRSRTYANKLGLLSGLYKAGVNNPNPEPELKNSI